MSNATDLEIQIILIICLVAGTFIISHIAKHNGFSFLRESVVGVLLGSFVGLIAALVGSGDLEHRGAVNSNFFFIALLPPIVFEAGFSVDHRTFFRNFWTILSLAFLGTIVGAFGTAAILYAFCSLFYPISFLEALTFGSLASATDPVSVIATLQQFPINRNMYMLIFGESALNDAIAIIIYKLMIDFASPTFGPITLSTVAITACKAVGVFVGSFAIGIAIGVFLAFITKYGKMADEVSTEISLATCSAMLSYVTAEIIGLSGIVAVLFNGIAIANYVAINWSAETQCLCHDFFKTIASIAETTTFIYVGLSVFAFNTYIKYNGLFELAAFAGLFISRLHVFPIISIANFRRDEKVTFRQQVFIWYGGLRGGVSFILALGLVLNDNFRYEFRCLVLGTTVLVVFVSILILGIGCSTTLRFLDLIEDEENVDVDGDEKDSDSDTHSLKRVSTFNSVFSKRMKNYFQRTDTV